MAGWRLPGGGVERGEPPRPPMLRELAEEVGLVGRRCRFFGALYPQGRLGHRVVALYSIDGAAVNFRPNLEIRDICFGPIRMRRRPAARPATLRRLAELTGARRSRPTGSLPFGPRAPISESP